MEYNRRMLEIIKAFVGPQPDRQQGIVAGKYYDRTGACNMCGKCCTNIYLIHEEKTVESIEEFETLKPLNLEYEYFRPVGETEHGVLFQCNNLTAENNCSIYENRPDFCRLYPTETGLMMGGKLAENCGYTFKLKKSFDAVLAEAKNKKDDYAVKPLAATS